MAKYLPLIALLALSAIVPVTASAQGAVSAAGSGQELVGNWQGTLRACQTITDFCVLGAAGWIV